MTQMDSEIRFKIVFDKLEAMRGPAENGQPRLADEVAHLREELDELAELRRLAADISDPEPTSYTST